MRTPRAMPALLPPPQLLPADALLPPPQLLPADARRETSHTSEQVALPYWIAAITATAIPAVFLRHQGENAGHGAADGSKGVASLPSWGSQDRNQPGQGLHRARRRRRGE